MNDTKPNIYETLAMKYRDRLREIEDMFMSIELRTGRGSDAKAAVAAMTEDEYKYIRQQAIIP